MYQSKKELIKIKKNNARMYAIYKMISWDLLFYYSIVFLFLTLTKNLSIAQVMFVNATYPLFKILVQIPCTSMVEKMGKKNSVIIGNIFVALSIFLLIICNGIIEVIISNVFSAVGYTLKTLATSNLLYDSVTTKEGKGMYSKLEQRGASYYYYLDGIASILTGFFFVFNNYLPMVICLIITIISTIMSFRFKEIIPKTKPKKQKMTTEIKEYMQDLKLTFNFILKSRRLKSLLLVGITFGSLPFLFNTCRTGILTELNINAEYFRNNICDTYCCCWYWNSKLR